VVVSRDAGPEPIRIFVTGGTFDKEYDELTGQLYFKDSHLPEMLKLGRCNLPLEMRTLRHGSVINRQLGRTFQPGQRAGVCANSQGELRQEVLNLKSGS
jgi:hypothetical protein